jgi:NADPH-dependent 2,4-dienoyl-CoA reductase/sulfur reductase-like enzyme
MQEYYESKGIKFLLGQQVTSFLGNVSVSEVVTDKRTKIPADFVVAGIGVILNNELAKASGLEMTERGEVIVDEYLRTSDPNIWAAGDITYFNDIAMGTKWHVEHNQNAKWQGRQAGAIMAGDSKPYNKVAYFYSDVFDIHLNIRGAIHLTTQSKMLGDVKSGEFVELYYNDAGQLRMTIACSHDDHKLDPISDKAEELIRAKANVNEITTSTFGL